MSMIYGDEFRARSQRTGMLSVALALVTGLQSITMFFAMRELLAGSGGAEGIVIPIGAGVVIGVAFWIAWHWLSRVGPLAHSPVNRLLFTGLAGALTAVAICTTSWFIASAIGGGTALQAHMQSHLAKTSDQLAIVTTNATAEHELSDRLGQIEAAWRLLAEGEERGVVGPKGKGCGPDCEMYKRASATYATSRANVEVVFDEFNVEKEKAQQLRADMNAIASGDATTEGQAKFSGLAAQYAQQIAKMDALTALPRVGGGIVEVGQKNGIVTLKNEELTRDLKARVKAIKAARLPVPVAIYASTSRAKATLDYASAVPGAWLVGVAFDLLPLIMFLMMMLAFSEARTPHQPLPAFIRRDGRELDVLGPHLVQSDRHPAE